MEALLKLQKRTIQITENDSIYLKEQTLFFADGSEGLHLWESSVLLSRYIKNNSEDFKTKRVIELGTGCGLCGISCLLYTQCEHVTFSDNQEPILSNLKDNIKMNNIKDNSRYSISNINWKDYATYGEKKYDIIIGSELVYEGGLIEELSKLIANLLKNDGVGYIVMPENRFKTNTFLDYLKKNGLKWSKEYLKNDNFFIPILKDTKEAKKLYSNLEELKIILYTIKKE